MRSSVTRFCALALLSGAVMAATACSKDAGTAATPAADTGRGTAAGRAGGRGGRGGGVPVPVTVTTVVQKPMAVNVRVVGNVEAASTVGIRSQVTGALQTVHFKEGDEVTAGQL